MAPELTDLRLDRPREGVVVLSLDNPAQRNAMSEAMTVSWGRAIDEIVADPAVRAVVVTGEGSAFSSGGNTSWLAAEPDASVDALRTRMQSFYRAWLRIREIEVPTIAAINGPAIGAGLCIALACDLRYAADTAKLGVPFVKLGLHPGMASTWLLPDVVGASHARELLLTGRVIDAAQALRIGLVSEVMPAETLREDVLEIATEIAGNAPIATRLTKVAMRNGGHRDIESAIQWEALAQPITMATADLLEGISAVQGKRRPVFRGE